MDEEDLKTQRRVRKSAFTKQMNKVKQLRAEKNPAQVKIEVETLIEKFKNFETACENYHETLEADKDIDDSDKYFSDTQGSYIDFLNSTDEWLKPQEAANPMNDQALVSKDGNSNLVSAMCLPKIELEKFNGDPSKYHTFMALFDETVDKVATDDTTKLTRLIRYTTGRAHNAISPCIMMDGSTGYKHARKLLLERYGNCHLVSEHLISSLVNGKPIRSADELQAFCDELVNCNMTLQQMGRIQEVQNQTYIASIANRFENYIRNRWKKRALDIKKEQSRYPLFGEFVEFVQEQTLEAIDPVYGKTARNSKEVPNKKASFATLSSHHKEGSTFKHSCTLCKGEHRLSYCQQFKDMKVNDRLTLVKNNQLCENCLLSNHSTSNCRRPDGCSVPGCNKRHSKFIHVPSHPRGQIARNATGSDVNLVNANVNVDSNVYMPVVAVNVNGVCQACSLLDTASSSSFCTRQLLDALNLKGTPITYSLNTLGNSQEVQSNVVNLTLTSLDGQENLQISNVYVVDSIPFESACPEPGAYSHLRGLRLVAGGQNVNLLLGQDNAEALMPMEVRRGIKGEPYACRTLFGWSVNGPNRVDGPASSRVISQFISTSSLEVKVQRLWELENDGLYDSNVALSQDDKRVIELWDESCKLVNNHYVIPIPWKDGVEVPNNLIVAMSRLKSLKLSLNKRGLLPRYDSEIQKLLDNGYAEKVPECELELPENVWYLPHHGVISDKKPEKLRVVFDCAAKYCGESINDKCYRGPDMNNKLLNVLVRFRQHEIAVQGDIEAMYYQVKVPVEERNFLRFLWYDVSGNIVQYRMTGHVFGGIWCSSSSTYALRRTVDDSPNVHALVKDCVSRSFYVDDCLISVNDKNDAKVIIDGTRSVLSKGGFHLTKFISNESDVLSMIPEEEQAKEAKELNPCSKALGVRWNVLEDEFYFDVKVQNGEVVTRRVMLSVVASCFDPLGLISPFIVGGKLLFQEVTRLKLPWDQLVSQDIRDSWNRWVSVIQNLGSLRIPRCIKPSLFDDAMIELHHFSDASLRAYGTCCYVRGVNKQGTVFTLLVASKGKVAPINAVTIPRLELQAAVLSIHMDGFLRKELDISLCPSYFWSDSSVVLSYIRSESHRFHVFVANRVGVIREASDPSQWHHVPGTDNPADLITRNQDLSHFDTHRWLHGPDFLSLHKSEWNIDGECFKLPENDPEVKTESKVFSCATVAVAVDEIDKIVQHYSSWYRLKRAIAWLLRFKDFLGGCRKFDRHLTVEELGHSEVSILRYVQGKSYHKERALLSSGKLLNNDSSVKALNPVIGSDGLLRVGGRIKHAAVYDVCVQPVLIPNDQPITRCIVNDFHSIAHLGTEWTVSEIRKKYWITKIRVVVKSVARRCLTCKKLFGSTVSQVMADLPSERLEPYKRPFSYTGVDCFGPFYVKQGRSQVKRYGCIFTCLSVRAVHIERICSLDTDSFICALRRFVSRRGCPEKLFCDNGTNLVGASAELKRSLKELQVSRIHDECLKQHIEWHFNPPKASHMGGIWERLIRVIRKVLSGLFDVNASISDEMLETVFTEAESIINGRPITKLSEDPSDSHPLTPNHLLLIGSGHLMSPGTFSTNDIYRRKWRFVQHLVEQFWKKWLRCYLPELQRRIKWWKPQRNVAVGDLVLIKDENTPRNVWPMGLVVEVNSSDDGFVRSVKLKTKSTTLVRPVHKLVLLEGVN